MAVEVYRKEDVAQRIAAIAIAMVSAAYAHGGGNVEYIRGIYDTSRAQCANYGIQWGAVEQQIAATVGDVKMVEG